MYVSCEQLQFTLSEQIRTLINGKKLIIAEPLANFGINHAPFINAAIYNFEPIEYIFSKAGKGGFFPHKYLRALVTIISNFSYP